LTYDTEPADDGGFFLVTEFYVNDSENQVDAVLAEFQ
jgi:hypothetical protein